MSRPKPTVLLEHTDPATYKTEQVLAASGIYAVFYKGKPMALRTITKPNPAMVENQAKYKMVNFSNHAHAVNLAERLNKQYNCNDFTVCFMSDGEPFQESSV